MHYKKEKASYKITVVVPVYNASKFIKKAVESALIQPETCEVLLIEDGSLDSSLQICEEVIKENQNVILLRHPDGKNHGAGASRNLGIINAKYPYIAFLDADDFYLADRFKVAKTIFESDLTVDGVYEAIGVYFNDEKAKTKWGNRKMLTTMSKRVSPDNLFNEMMPIGKSGYFSIDGLIVKKNIFKRVGLFDENLRLHQDTAFFVKVAALCKLVPGRLNEPVAMRRVHDGNRYISKRSFLETYRHRILMWRVLWKWAERELEAEKREIILNNYLKYASKPYRLNIKMINVSTSFCQLMLEVFHDVKLINKKLFWKNAKNTFYRE
ncbi:MAG: glycosyltransferase family 2 protein [Promethearchaeota archaeon]